MHADEVETDAGLVRRLVRSQFPAWERLPVRPVDSGGTVNAIHRLGAELVVRLPLTGDGVEALEREARWLPVLGPRLPVAVPTVVAVGEPGEGYPHPWAVHRWIPGEVLREGGAPDPAGPARDLAGVVVAFREVSVDAAAPRAHRAGSPAAADDETREAIAALARTDEPFDPLAPAAWDACLEAAPWNGPPCWSHSDLMPGNLLRAGNRLAAVLDFGTVVLGEPAVDLIPAWNFLPAAARRIFRERVEADDDTWARGRAWALSMALVQLPYCRVTNPVISANARYVIRQVLAGG